MEACTPRPKIAAEMPMRPIAGAAWPKPATVMIGTANRRNGPRVSAIPRGTATSTTISVALRATVMCSRNSVVSGPALSWTRSDSVSSAVRT